MSRTSNCSLFWPVLVISFFPEDKNKFSQLKENMNIDEEIQIQLDQSEAAVMLERVGINFPTDVSERALQYLVAEYSAKVIHSR